MGSISPFSKLTVEITFFCGSSFSSVTMNFELAITTIMPWYVKKKCCGHVLGVCRRVEGILHQIWNTTEKLLVKWAIRLNIGHMLLFYDTYCGILINHDTVLALALPNASADWCIVRYCVTQAYSKQRLGFNILMPQRKTVVTPLLMHHNTELNHQYINNMWIVIVLLHWLALSLEFRLTQENWDHFFKHNFLKSELHIWHW